MKHIEKEIISVMRKSYGMDIAMFDGSFLAQAVLKRRAGLPDPYAADYPGYIAVNRLEADELFQSLNITFSEFFRNSLTFALLEQIVLPGLVKARGGSGSDEIRVWSAGCSAGQEAYSIAILFDELNAGRSSPVPYRIFASDNSEDQLESARKGVYDALSVQNVKVKHIEKYFSFNNGMYTIIPRLKERIEFIPYDLLDKKSSCPAQSIYGDFDLVLCCNLLFYYRSDCRKAIIKKLVQCIAPGGFFVTGEAERALFEAGAGLRSVSRYAPVFNFKRRRSDKNEVC